MISGCLLLSSKPKRLRGLSLPRLFSPQPLVGFISNPICCCTCPIAETERRFNSDGIFISSLQSGASLTQWSLRSRSAHHRGAGRSSERISVFLFPVFLVWPKLKPSKSFFRAFSSLIRFLMVTHVGQWTVMADSDAQETRQTAKDSPFSIKNLLNIEDKPTKPKSFLASSKGVFDGSFFSRLGDLSFPRFELPTQRIGLSAQYLERAPAWWYPYTLGTHLRTGGKWLETALNLQIKTLTRFLLNTSTFRLIPRKRPSSHNYDIIIYTVVSESFLTK